MSSMEVRRTKRWPTLLLLRHVIGETADEETGITVYALRLPMSIRSQVPLSMHPSARRDTSGTKGRTSPEAAETQPHITFGEQIRGWHCGG